MKALHNLFTAVLMTVSAAAFAAASGGVPPQPAGATDLHKAIVTAQAGPRGCAANGSSYPVGAKICKGDGFIVCKADGTWATTGEKCGEK